MSGRGIAIVGMGALFPGAPDLATFWRNIRDGVDAIDDAPASRLDPVWFEPAAEASAGRFGCRRGGFVAERDAVFDPGRYGVMPSAADAADPDQLLGLKVADAALADITSGRLPDRERIGVIVGRGGYLTSAQARLDQRVRVSEQLVRSLKDLLPELGHDRIEDVRASFLAELGRYAPSESIGLVPNLAASRLADRLDLRGPAFVVDAACASALVALDIACQELVRGRCDVVLAGGVHLCHDPTFWSVFNQLGAISASQQIRPFDQRADGLLIGEGIGMLALKRLEDARRDGDRVYAVVQGTGIASDGRGASLMSPRVAGQVLALRRAWEEAGLDPTTVGLVEAHGTGTKAGDEAELQTLAKVFGPVLASDERTPLGSVKSMIGHAMPAAGAAGLIKTALSIFHAVRPPSLHCNQPHPLLSETRFRIPKVAEPWDDEHRIAGVDAFGFGGIDAHAVMTQETHAGGTLLVDIAARAADDKGADLEAAVMMAGKDAASLLARLERGEPGGRGPHRLVVFDPTPERLATAAKIVKRGGAWRGRRDIFYSADDLLGAGGGRVAFVFPGVEATTLDPPIEDVASHFHLARPAQLGETDLEQAGAALVGVGRLLDDALRLIGLRADAYAGHSVGEWSGMIASGLIPPGEIDAFVGSLTGERLEVPDVLFAAIGAGVERIEPLLAGLEGVEISHDNCPRQAILCGTEAGIRAATDRLHEARIMAHALPFKSGFHSSRFKPHLAPHLQHLARLPLAKPTVPLWSATTCAPYPDDPDAVRKLAADHLVEPVRFRELIEAMYAEGFRVFVQVGPGNATGFIADTLGDRPHLAAPASTTRRTGLGQLRRVAAAMAVEGADIRFDALPWADHQSPCEHRLQHLALGAPLVRLHEPLELEVKGTHARDVEPDTHPVVAEFDATLDDALEAREAVLASWHRARTPQQQVPKFLHETVTFSVDAYPDLIDHTFFRQAKGWPSMAGRFPVVPMTMLIEHMMTTARRLAPGRVPIAVERIRAWRWLAVAPDVAVDVTAERVDADRVSVRVGDFTEGVVRFADSWPEPHAPALAPLTSPAPSDVPAARLYADRWMFHGPAYRGVARIDGVGTDGIDGLLTATAAPGALLDNAGQLMGLWILLNTTVDRLAFPWRIARMAFYGEHPAPGEELVCRVRVQSMDDTLCKADLELLHHGRVWARIDGWEDRRFDTDERIYPVLRFPETKLISEPRADGSVLSTQRWKSSASGELLARRVLNDRELELWFGLTPRDAISWLVERMAIKDAARRVLLETGAREAVFPAEADVVAEDEDGLWRVEVAGEPPLIVRSEPTDEGVRAWVVAD